VLGVADRHRAVDTNSDDTCQCGGDGHDNESESCDSRFHLVTESVRPYFVVSTTNLSCDEFGDSDGTEEVDVVNL
jgi:hypothetical protein